MMLKKIGLYIGSFILFLSSSFTYATLCPTGPTINIQSGSQLAYCNINAASSVTIQNNVTIFNSTFLTPVLAIVGANVLINGGSIQASRINIQSSSVKLQNLQLTTSTFCSANAMPVSVPGSSIRGVYTNLSKVSFPGAALVNFDHYGVPCN